jgi:TonB family protein
MIGKVFVLSATVMLAPDVGAATDACDLPGIPAAVTPGTIRPGKVKTAVAIFAPRPDYPKSARERHWTGSSCFVMDVDTKSGFVKSVEIIRSTGHKILDDEVIKTFGRWRFEPDKAAPKVKFPITFSMTSGKNS